MVADRERGRPSCIGAECTCCYCEHISIMRIILDKQQGREYVGCTQSKTIFINHSEQLEKYRPELTKHARQHEAV